jgi:hypothetical protein
MALRALHFLVMQGQPSHRLLHRGIFFPKPENEFLKPGFSRAKVFEVFFARPGL